MDNGNSGRIASAKSRFNIVDVIVIVLALLLVFAFFWAFDPFGWFSSSEAQEPISLYYTVEIKGLMGVLPSYSSAMVSAPSET